ncbi:hypothetical protein L3X38_026669 [Prunus dulcis]|uniref:Uncharacterized protein n=1 Tax=Prunus dulcis TaxID=3755 RepID=A0AAD4VLL9_PRUDU|nr:hypothetical protein L3X38_026669 [Prunus dulcis]
MPRQVKRVVMVHAGSKTRSKEWSFGLRVGSQDFGIAWVRSQRPACAARNGKQARSTIVLKSCKGSTQAVRNVDWGAARQRVAHATRNTIEQRTACFEEFQKSWNVAGSAVA